mmetsp:Transcript_19451/g.45306  ORF Transcript_19451/g.45306 Transcript_19451/m.45306 type:complete len:146 (+) Transcript_19451:136-573(+)|eukprot:CAMPEP_0197199606 /NCGR_PEP_ID=MMETSP1423-20130617/33974_1 /TAXON_ID=476441 /ORGANISM="Pseudo-nitzschia heimii, Strain UNC1101" /LENGTH=145 /DNA_ID=CAMNT_0042653469 /DNA_START=126 /DNA_END=563 /DNA_ORIENTATION=-
MKHQQNKLANEPPTSSRRSSIRGKKRVRFNDQIETFVIKSRCDCGESISSSFFQSLPPIKPNAQHTIRRSEQRLCKSGANFRSITAPPELFFPLSPTLRVPPSLLSTRWECTKDHLRDQAPTPAVRLNRLGIIDMALQITINGEI